MLREGCVKVMGKMRETSYKFIVIILAKDNSYLDQGSIWDIFLR